VPQPAPGRRGDEPPSSGRGPKARAGRPGRHKPLDSTPAMLLISLHRLWRSVQVAGSRERKGEQALLLV